MLREIVLTSVDLPWPLAPRMPMRWPASTLLLMLRTIAFFTPSGGMCASAGSSGSAKTV